MKLEIKHVAAYLPYGIVAEMLDYKIDYVGKRYDKIVGMHQWDKSGDLWSLLTVGGSKPSLDSVKLQLRPLSDLTTEIEHNDEKFVPIERLYQFNKNILNNPWDMNVCLYLIDAQSPLHCHYEIIQKLFEWHFDCFNLIENNLAVDINTLNK